ncbi:carboxypeptidase-like regulatory domain-containing protein [Phytomonospora sp. NPDC050363]|uniref:carboxypeptidase-like regulatory domain-containing protein n=1 Tax=Phytomonospora sp. NPDC050363 TaxID=3155642 RepID=UPI0033C8EEAA
MSDSMSFDPDRSVTDPPPSPPPARGAGTVLVAVSTQDGRPLADIGVEVRAIGMETPWTVAMDLPRTTDLRGQYIWTGLPAGEYAFAVRVPGRRRSQPRRVRLAAGETRAVVFTVEG